MCKIENEYIIITKRNVLHAILFCIHKQPSTGTAVKVEDGLQLYKIGLQRRSLFVNSDKVFRAAYCIGYF